MKMATRTLATIVMILTVMISSCATGRNQLSPDEITAYMQAQHEAVFGESNAMGESNPLDETTAIQETITIPDVEYIAPEEEETTPETNGSPAQQVYSNTLAYTVEPDSRQFDGGIVTYPYMPNKIYRIFTAPLQITAIVFEEGEELVSDPVAGNTANFNIDIDQVIQNNRPRTHLYITAQFSGYETSMIVNTNRRTYRFSLISYQNTFMPSVYFNYPLSDAASAQRQLLEQRQNNISINVPIENLDMNYDIIPMSIHRPAWTPSSTFTDGEKTYISFSSASKASAAPILLEVYGRSQRRLVPYRVVGTWYVVDRVLDHFELLVDTNNGNVVTIKRQAF
jgi:P-type conjugative transfer protein TrbG